MSGSGDMNFVTGEGRGAGAVVAGGLRRIAGDITKSAAPSNFDVANPATNSSSVSLIRSGGKITGVDDNSSAPSDSGGGMVGAEPVHCSCCSRRQRSTMVDKGTLTEFTATGKATEVSRGRRLNDNEKQSALSASSNSVAKLAFAGAEEFEKQAKARVSDNTNQTETESIENSGNGAQTGTENTLPSPSDPSIWPVIEIGYHSAATSSIASQDIRTPGWRVLEDEDSFDFGDQNDDKEDTSDAAYAKRHRPRELAERRFPGLYWRSAACNRSRRSSSSARAGDHQPSVLGKNRAKSDDRAECGPSGHNTRQDQSTCSGVCVIPKPAAATEPEKGASKKSIETAVSNDKQKNKSADNKKPGTSTDVRRKIPCREYRRLMFEMDIFRGYQTQKSGHSLPRGGGSSISVAIGGKSSSTSSSQRSLPSEGRRLVSDIRSAVAATGGGRVVGATAAGQGGGRGGFPSLTSVSACISNRLLRSPSLHPETKCQHRKSASKTSDSHSFHNQEVISPQVGSQKVGTTYPTSSKVPRSYAAHIPASTTSSGGVSSEPRSVRTNVNRGKKLASTHRQSADSLRASSSHSTPDQSNLESDHVTTAASESEQKRPDISAKQSNHKHKNEKP